MDPMLVNMIMGVLATLVSFVVMVVAIAVAVVVQRRKQGAAAGWLLAVGRAGICFTVFMYLMNDLVLTRLVGFGIGLQIMLILLKLLIIAFALVSGVALLMFKPEGAEVSHG